jgi:hypothetical protein
MHPRPATALLAPPYTRHVVGVADCLAEQPVPDLPGEDRGALPLVVGHLVHDARRRHAWLRAADCPRFYRPGLIVSGQGPSSHFKKPKILYFLNCAGMDRRNSRLAAIWREKVPVSKETV